MWEWGVNTGQIRRTIRNTSLYLHLTPGNSSPSSFARAPSAGKTTGLQGAVEPSVGTAKQDNETARSNDSSGQAPFHRSPSSGKEVASQPSVTVHAVMQSLEAPNDILSLGIKEVTGMPMLRRDSKGGPWLKREGFSPPPIHVTIDGMVPSLVDVMGQYTLVDESWADTDRPLYVNFASKGRSSDVRPHNAMGLQRAPSGGEKFSRMPSLGASSGLERAPSGGSSEFQGIAHALEGLSRQPSGHSLGGMLQV